MRSKLLFLNLFLGLLVTSAFAVSYAEGDESITISKPVGGESWCADSAAYTIEWDAQGGISKVDIYYSTDGISWDIVDTDINANPGSYLWTIPDSIRFESDTCHIRICDHADQSPCDNSEHFTITPQTINITSPTSDSNWCADHSHAITWNSGCIDSVSVACSTGIGWSTLALKILNTGRYDWAIPENVSGGCKVRICDSDNFPCDTSQAFTISPQTINITSPTSDSNWCADHTYIIGWSADCIDLVDIYYSTNGSTWAAVATGINANPGSYLWTIPDSISTESDTCHIRLCDHADSSPCDTSEHFTIRPQTVNITSPTSDSIWCADHTHKITWTSDCIDTVRIEYSTGQTWSILAAKISNSGSYNWSVPENVSGVCRIRVCDYPDNTPCDTSDTFTIRPQTLNVTSPTSDSNWCAGHTYDIKWNSDCVDLVDIYYSTNTGTSWNTVATGVSASLQSYSWAIPENVFAGHDSCKVKISDYENDVPWDTSGGFTIRPQSIEVTSPASDSNWCADHTHKITWTSDCIDTVRIEYSTGQTWSILAAKIANSGSYNWLVPENVSGACRIRVCDYPDNTPCDTSDTFTISPQTINITSPTSSSNWCADHSYAITWNSGCIDSVSVACSTGLGWTILTPKILNTGRYDWAIPENVSGGCKVRICDSDNFPCDTSQTFTIRPQTIGITSPTSSSNWCADHSYNNITWSSGCVDSVRIDYSTGQGWLPVVEKIPNTGSYYWPIPQNVSGTCQIRICDYPDNYPCNTSESFTIKPQTINITSPTSSSNWCADITSIIRWNSECIEFVNIMYSTNGGSRWDTVEKAIAAEPDSFVWSIPENMSGACKIRICDYPDNNPCHTSESFTIKPQSIKLKSPNGGEVWCAGVAHEIAWDTGTCISLVKIEYSTDGGSHWILVDNDKPNNGHYYWIPSDTSSKYRIRVSDSDDSPSDTSDNNFTVRASPGNPALKTPADKDTNISINPTSFAWTAVGEAHSYGIQIASTKLFTNTVFDTSGITGTTIQVQGLFGHSAYYWHVNVTTECGTSVWTNPWFFETVNNAPWLVDSLLNDTFVYENQPLELQVKAHDDDIKDTLKLTATLLRSDTLPNDALLKELNDSTAVLVWTPDYDQVKTGIQVDTIIFSVRDFSTTGSTNFKSDTETVAITVKNVNRAPILDSIGSKSVFEGETLSFNIVASDYDGTIPKLSVRNKPATNSSFDSTNGNFTFKPNFDQEGSNFVTFIASDDSSSDSEKVEIAVDELEPRYIDFKKILIVACAETSIITHNWSLTQTLTIDSVKHNNNITQAQAGHFPATIEPNKDDTAIFKFCPKSVGLDTAGIWFYPHSMDSIKVRYQGEGIQYSLVIKPDSLPFGPWNEMDTSDAKTVTVSNVGTASAKIDSIKIRNSDFFIGVDSCSYKWLDPAHSCSLGVQYSPSSKGADSDSIAFYHNSSYVDYRVKLTGKGVVPILTVTPDSIDFDTVKINDSSTDSICLKNSGDGFLTIGSITVTDTNNYSLGNVPTDKDTISPGESLFVHVVFAPERYRGEKPAQVFVYAYDDTATVDLIGFAEKGDWEIVCDREFKDVRVGTSVTRSCSIKNLKVDPYLDVQDIWFKNGICFNDSAENLPVRLESNQEYSYDITFYADKPGECPDTLIFHLKFSNRPDSIQKYWVKGYPVAPEIRVSPVSLSFDSVATGSISDTLFVVVRNVGKYVLNVDSVKLKKDSDFLLTWPDGEPPWWLDPDIGKKVGVAFAPSDTGRKVDTLLIFSDAYPPNDTLKKISLSGEGYIPDYAPPQLDSVKCDAEFRKTVTLWAYLTDSISGVRSVWMHYRQGNSNDTGSVDTVKEKTGDQYKGGYKFEITDTTIVSLNGLEYQIGAVDKHVPPNDSVYPLESIPVRFSPEDSVRMHSWFWYHDSSKIDDRWVLLSIPGDINNKRQKDIFDDPPLGEPGGSTWHLMTWDGNNYDSVEYEDDGLQPGRGFWFKCIHTKNPFTVRLGDGQTLPTSTPCEIQLFFSAAENAKGWNLIGNPFFFNLIADSLLAKYDSLDGFYSWDGTDWDFPEHTLEPWKGYAVKNNYGRSIILQVDPHTMADTHSLSTPRWSFDFLWTVDLSVKSGTFVDKVKLGSDEVCSERKDKADFPRPPHIEPKVSVYFPKHDWGIFSDAYATDYRGIINDGASWDFAVDNYTDQKELELSWEGVDSLPSELEAVLYDRMQNDTINMKEKDSYSFTHLKNQDPNRFKVFVGRPGYIENEITSTQSAIPKEFNLRQNYPNPFNSGTAINFDIPQGGQVKIRVYNILGQAVVTLYDKLTYPGKYTITWDGKDKNGKDVSSGIYFYQLSAPGFIKSMKMILLK